MSRFQHLLDLHDEGKLKFKLTWMSDSDYSREVRAVAGRNGIEFVDPRDAVLYQYFPLKDGSGWATSLEDISLEDSLVADAKWNRILTEEFKDLGGDLP